MTKKKDEKKVPVYAFKDFEGESDLPPVKRTIAKTMEVTETFNYFDALAYKMKMEKALKDKEAELEGLNNMIEAYDKELKIIEEKFDINKLEKDYQLGLYHTLNTEEVDEKIEEAIKK